MELLYPRCAGLDIHKKTVVACRVLTPDQGPKQEAVRTFGTTTPDLLGLLDWLQEWGCTHVAMESTGEYWKPVYNILEGTVEILLVNAQHVRTVPGRKTDVNDAQWLAELLRHGLLKGSYVPPKPQRQLRALTRQRSNLVAQRAMVVNWLQKVLEDANIKLASVATAGTGVSARAMLAALVDGEAAPAAIAAWARGRMRAKRDALEAALTGSVEDHHRFLITQHLLLLDTLEEQIERFSERIAAQVALLSPAPPPAEPPAASREPPPAAATGPARGGPPAPSYQQALALLDAIPGINRNVAEAILAEIGTRMAQFPTAAHLCSWAGVAPGNRESAGKRYSGKTTEGNPALRKALVQAAHGAIRTQGSSFGAVYHRLARRRGKQRAVIAVARKLLIVVYHVLLTGMPYRELGANYLDERKRESLVQHLVRRLEKLGHQVSLALQPAAAAACGR
jgi:transposase